MTSNVDLAEVQAVDLRSLKGLDDVIESLEANVVLPFENDRLATELRIKPKRGVLIIGPPGTGKTTVGRALAHRLKSKFFLIDGTFITGTRDFYEKIRNVIEAAKQNSPSIIFIDDSDVIFETGKEQGLYRYLLTLLDGIESDSSGQVCVMMTAMDVGGLPPALIRSGRIELWLETRLPDAMARAQVDPRGPTVGATRGVRPARPDAYRSGDGRTNGRRPETAGRGRKNPLRLRQSAIEGHAIDNGLCPRGDRAGPRQQGALRCRGGAHESDGTRNTGRSISVGAVGARRAGLIPGR
jgi:hypothetical protein